VSHAAGRLKVNIKLRTRGHMLALNLVGMVWEGTPSFLYRRGRRILEEEEGGS